MLRSDLYDYADAYILVNGTIRLRLLQEQIILEKKEINH